MLPILRRNPEVVIWWATRVECASALARAVRRGEVESGLQHHVRRRLTALWRRCLEVEPAGGLRERAVRLLVFHTLRAADAMQLAAALDWCEEQTTGAGFVCLDERLRAAALLEGFDVLPWTGEVHEP